MFVEEISWAQFKENLIELEWSEYQQIAENSEDKENFFRLRRSQFALWSEEMIESRFWDLENAEQDGHNLLVDKYSWILKYTDPEGYEKTKLNLVTEDVDKETLMNIITTIETEWFMDADYILDIAWKLSAPRIKTLIDVYGIPKTESVKNQWDYEISKFHSYKTKKKDSESKECNFDAELFDLPTCCAYLNLGRHTVKKIAEEANAIRKYGSTIRYSRSAIVSYLDNGMKNGQLL